MIRLDVAQGSPEWFAARLGIPTASQFDKIITNKTAKLSDQSTKYAYTLLFEQLTGAPYESGSGTFMERGSELEDKAVSYYELQRDVETEAVGFVLRDDRRVGCSPDRLVGADGLLEIKVPNGPNHLAYLLGGETVALEYRAQCQGQLWLTGRHWVDTVSFSPALPSALVRVARDDEYIAKLAAAIDQFLSQMDEIKLKLQRSHGLFPEFEAPTLRVA